MPLRHATTRIAALLLATVAPIAAQQEREARELVLRLTQKDGSVRVADADPACALRATCLLGLALVAAGPMQSGEQLARARARWARTRLDTWKAPLRPADRALAVLVMLRAMPRADAGALREKSGSHWAAFRDGIRAGAIEADGIGWAALALAGMREPDQAQLETRFLELATKCWREHGDDQLGVEAAMFLAQVLFAKDCGTFADRMLARWEKADRDLVAQLFTEYHAFGELAARGREPQRVARWLALRTQREAQTAPTVRGAWEASLGDVAEPMLRLLVRDAEESRPDVAVVPSQLTLRIVERDGRTPVPGFAIALRPATGFQLNLDGLTDENGVLRIENAPRGKVGVGIAPGEQGHAPASNVFTWIGHIEVARSRDAELTLQRPAR